MPFPVVWRSKLGTTRPLCEQRIGSPLVIWDPVSGPAVPDTSLGINRTHGLGLHDVGSQVPVRLRIAGDSFTHAIPPEGNTGCRGTVYRSQRFPAISRIHPESTITIGAISRQSYQYVAPLTPVKMPFNAFGNPRSPSGIPTEVVQIGQFIPPALEPPRWNYTGLSTEQLQQDHDAFQVKLQMMGRGVQPPRAPVQQKRRSR